MATPAGITPLPRPAEEEGLLVGANVNNPVWIRKLDRLLTPEQKSKISAERMLEIVRDAEISYLEQRAEEKKGQDDAQAPPARLDAEDEHWSCPLCLKLLHLPITTGCGHTFCKSCMATLCEHTKNDKLPTCPTCRAVLPFGGASDLRVSITLQRLIGAAFPKEAAERQREDEAEVAAARERQKEAATAATAAPAGARLPIFVLCPLLPRQQMSLHVFEQRYRTLVSRALQGGRRFGMAASTGSEDACAAFGTEVEIVDARQTADGRYMVRVVARRIFEVQSVELTEAGYINAEIKWRPLYDGAPEEGGAAEGVGDGGDGGDGGNGDRDADQAVVATAQAMGAKIARWEALVEQYGYQRYPGQLREIKEHLGQMPGVGGGGGQDRGGGGGGGGGGELVAAKMDAVRRAVWVGALINPVPGLGVAREIRYDVLSLVRDPAQLVATVDHALDQSILYIKPSQLRLALGRAAAGFLDRLDHVAPGWISERARTTADFFQRPDVRRAMWIVAVIIFTIMSFAGSITIESSNKTNATEGGGATGVEDVATGVATGVAAAAGAGVGEL